MKKYPAPVIRKNRQGMNKTEERYAQRLEMMRMRGEILGWKFEPFGIKLAPKTYYHPDFLVIYPGHFEVHEVKGFWRDDARVKIKTCAEMYPWFKFVAVYWKQSQWKFEEI